MGTPTRLMSFAEFEQLPDEPNKLELMDGELIRLSRNGSIRKNG